MKYLWLGLFFIVLTWSGINPKDQFTWLLEVIPAIIGLVLMASSYKHFKLTPILYGFILAHCIVLMVGGHYTYAEVPWFDNLFDNRPPFFSSKYANKEPADNSHPRAGRV